MPAKVVPREPTGAELRRLLGKSHAAFDAFLAKNADLRPEWKYYGAKLGWSLKLFEGRRNLCFLGPHEKFLNIAFVLGAKAVDAALESTLPDTVKQQVRDSPRYPEGRGVRLMVRSKKDLLPAQLLLEIKRST